MAKPLLHRRQYRQEPIWEALGLKLYPKEDQEVVERILWALDTLCISIPMGAAEERWILNPKSEFAVVELVRRARDSSLILYPFRSGDGGEVVGCMCTVHYPEVEHDFGRKYEKRPTRVAARLREIGSRLAGHLETQPPRNQELVFRKVSLALRLILRGVIDNWTANAIEARASLEDEDGLLREEPDTSRSGAPA